MKSNIILLVALCLICSHCTHPNDRSLKKIFAKDKANLEFTYFFNTKSNSEIANLDIKLDIAPPKTLTQALKQENYAIQYDKESEKKTRESLDIYLNELKDYTRYVFEFSFDSVKCKVFATDKYDITHIIMLNKYNNNFHFINESFFVYGTILKIIDSDIKSNNGDFNDITTEKTTVSLFDENKLFYKSEEKNKHAAKKIKINNEDAFHQIEEAFLFRQLCRDALLKLKDAQPEWFK